GAGLKQVPDSWLSEILQVLTCADKTLVREAVVTVRALPIPGQRAEKITVQLLRIAETRTFPAEVRLTAPPASPGGLGELKPATFIYLPPHLDGEKPVAVRSLAAEALAGAKLSTQQLLALGETLKTTGPMEVERLLEAFAKSTENQVGLK